MKYVKQAWLMVKLMFLVTFVGVRNGYYRLTGHPEKVTNDIL